MSKMNEIEKWSYIAGIFDGEGSICFAKTDRKYCTIQCALRIVNTNLDLIRWLLKNIPFSTKIYMHDKRNNSDAYVIQIQKQEGLKKFLTKIEPYAIVKKQQIKLAKEWAIKHIAYKRFIKNRNSKGQWIKGEFVVDRKWEIEIYNKVRELNGRNKSNKKIFLGHECFCNFKTNNKNKFFEHIKSCEWIKNNNCQAKNEQALNKRDTEKN